MTILTTFPYFNVHQTVRNSTLAEHGHLTTGESLASSAVKTAIDINAKLIGKSYMLSKMGMNHSIDTYLSDPGLKSVHC